MTPSVSPTPTATPTLLTLTPTASRTPTRTPFPSVQPPTIAPTRTPNPTVAPTLFTPPPGGTATFAPTTTALAPPTISFPGSGSIPGVPGTGDLGGVIRLGEGVIGVVSNLWSRSSVWATSAVNAAGRIFTAWNTSTPSAPPMMPSCKTTPLASELCAIWYILQNTLFSGPIGSLLIPTGVIVVDLFTILVLFIPLVRALLTRIAEVIRS
jgi:hypothetical protein